MSNLECLRKVYERWATGDFRAGPELWDRNFLFVMNSPLPDAGIYVGAAGMRDYMGGFLESWQRVHIAPLEFIEAGDSVVVPVRQRGAGKGSGAPAEMSYTQVWTFRGERAIRLENFFDHADALRAVGLAPG